MDILRKIKSGEYQIKEVSGESDVWKHFRKVVVTETNENVPNVICSECEKIFKFGKGTSSSNLKKHVCYKRKITRGNDSVPNKKQSLVNISDQLPEEISQKSFSDINDDGFPASFVEVNVKIDTKNVSTDDVLPHSTTTSRNLDNVPVRERETFVAYLRPIIQKGMCAATVNMWTDSKEMRNFIAFKLHYLDINWQLQNRILFTDASECCDENGVEMKKTAENIVTAIGDKFDKLNLGRDLLKHITFTTDHGSSIRKALKQHSRINCAANVLNNILKHTFDKETLKNLAPHVGDLIINCKLLMENLKRSGRIRMLETSAEKECPSRWSTKFQMLWYVCKNFNAIEDILEQSSGMFHLIGIEKFLLDRIINVLEPFKCVTLLLESEKNPTIHLVLSHMHILKEKLLKLLNEESNNEIRLIVKNCLDNIFDAKFCPEKIHKISAFLWPEYKQMRYLREHEREEVINLVKTELLKISQESSYENVQSCTTDLMLSKYKDVYLIKINNSESQINKQIEMYKTACYEENNILQWWRIHGDEFPLIAELARQILCIPASSTASERCFTLANRVLKERRTNIKAGEKKIQKWPEEELELLSTELVVVQVLLQTICDKVKDQPAEFEKPNAQIFYENIKCNVSILEHYHWTALRNKMSNIRVRYLEAAELKNKPTDAALVANTNLHNEKYNKIILPFWDTLGDIFNRYKEPDVVYGTAKDVELESSIDSNSCDSNDFESILKCEPADTQLSTSQCSSNSTTASVKRNGVLGPQTTQRTQTVQQNIIETTQTTVHNTHNSYSNDLFDENLEFIKLEPGSPQLSTSQSSDDSKQTASEDAQQLPNLLKYKEQNLVLEKEKVELEKERLKIEREKLDLEKEKMRNDFELKKLALQNELELKKIEIALRVEADERIKKYEIDLRHK